MELRDLSFRYGGAPEGSGLDSVSLRIAEGECVLLCGVSGCGKSTLLRLVNGLAPNFYEGELRGESLIGGVRLKGLPLYEIANYAGTVFQNPRSQFFNTDTTGELAFGCENRGLEPDLIRGRLERSVRLFRLERLVDRSIFELSGGEKQRIAIASVYMTGPGVFLLDEPSSNLDRESIRDLRMALAEIRQQGKTIIIAEHRLHYLAGLVDRVIYLERGRIAHEWSGEEFYRFPAPRLRELGLRATGGAGIASETGGAEVLRGEGAAREGDGRIEIQGLSYAYGGGKNALSIPFLALPRSDISALIGPNGAGKTTLAHWLCGLASGGKGTVRIGGAPVSRKERLRRSYLVMQDVNHQLFSPSVEEELRLGAASPDEATLRRVTEDLELGELGDRHPMSLSGGQKQRVAVAAALCGGKDLIVFDEPTSGLDYRHMEKVAAAIRRLHGAGTAVLLITHDPELILSCCTRVVHLEHGALRESFPLDAAGREKLIHLFMEEGLMEGVTERRETRESGAARAGAAGAGTTKKTGVARVERARE
ncbi:MAG: energy-coupling factor ABC transporter ATP-binding protein [Treponema sp.]|nr:energy-coupling factor ABC transporter ATP-binding protein [Treponema sp.]